MSKNNLIPSDFLSMEEKGKKLEALINLSKEMMDRENRQPITFNDFLFQTSNEPRFVLRDIFQLFFDMFSYYIPEGVEEYPDTESVGYVYYDSTDLFVNGCDDPFFADRLFINRLMNVVRSFKQGSLHNHIFLFEGPPGSGKSTFLDNLLQKVEDYTRTANGTIYKTYWRLDVERLGGFENSTRLFYKYQEEGNSSVIESHNGNKHFFDHQRNYLQFSCPRHDHPILQIPKNYRKQFLDELIQDKEFKDKLFNAKEYEWVLKDSPCNICQSLFSSLLEELNDPLEVFSMIYARKSHFNRQFGEGISIYNPGDALYEKPIRNANLEQMIHDLLKNDNVQFVFSELAKTNNGILALMDIKENNIERMKGLHGIISDGIHKVELVEERIKSLFMGLVNPEDKIHYETIKSYQDRIITVNIPYILDYNTEVEIYKNKFGKSIEAKFLPRVLENFAKIIISSRMETESVIIRRWIGNTEKYGKYMDKNSLLLKMDIYTGRIPDYLTEEDLKKFDKQMRKEFLNASENEGRKGFSGRQSINIFNEFISKFGRSDKLITMDKVQKYFSNNEKLYKEIPIGFLISLVDMYDYDVLQEVKEAIYYYNESQISRDILNYLFCINYESGETKKVQYTGDTIDIDEDFFKNFEAVILGVTSSKEQRIEFRNDTLNEYISNTLAQEIRIENKDIAKTTLYKSLFEKYTRNLKEYALAPYAENDNFRRAVKAFGNDEFAAYDDRIKRDIKQLIKNLIIKFKYSEEGAKEVCIYVLDKDLNKKY